MAVSAVRRLAFFCYKEPLETTSHMPHTGGTPAHTKTRP
jgi:hypothetical protein